MATVALLDVDEGSGSVQNLIDAGRVHVYDCSTFEKAENVLWGFYYGRYKADLVVVDSLSQLVTALVQVTTIDPENINPTTGKTIWNQRNKTRQNQDIWNRVNYMARAFTSGIRALGVPSIFTVHEVERIDPLAEGEVERRLPSLPPKIMEHLLARSDLIMRLMKPLFPFQVGNQTYPADTPCLQLKAGANVYTGTRLTPEANAQLEPIIPMPLGTCGLQKLYEAIGKLPKSMTVYGLPKVGKTVFSCTLPG